MNTFILLPAIRIIGIVSLLCLILTPSSAAQSGGSPDYSEAVAQARDVLEKIVAEDGFVGVSVSVGVGDSIVFAEGAGFAHEERQEAATPDHQFRIYSLAKPMTGVALARLWEEGRIDLDAPIETYLPSLNPALHGISARQLVGHLSGIRHYKKGEWLKVSKSPCASPAEALVAFASDPLEHVPGSQLSYSSFGFVLLSAVMEAAADQPFLDYITHRVFEPAEMTSIQLDDPNAERPLRAQPYEYRRRKFREARFVDNTCKMGAGGFTASSNDVARFGLALMNHQLVQPSTLEMILTSMKDASGEDTQYGFGLAVSTDAEGRGYAVHSGGAIGGRAALFLYPETNIVVAITANSEGRRLTEEAETIARFFYAAQ